MDFVITTYCNLNCPNCCALMPYYKERFYVDLETIKKSLKEIRKVVDSIYIVGGEIFLHPELDSIIDLLVQSDYNYIGLFTNATIIPDIIDHIFSVIDDRFNLCITDYGEKSKCINELIELCDKYKINYEMNEFGNMPGYKEGKEWVKWGNPSYKPIPKIDINSEEAKCIKRICCIRDKVYRCQRIGHLDQIKAIDLQDDEWCYVNELEDKYEMLQQGNYTKSCYYCLGGTKQAINIPKGS